MDNLRYTGQFFCHRGLPIHAACFDPACNGILGCIDCLLKKHLGHGKSIISIPELAEQADIHYTIMQNIRATEEPPKELKELVSKQDEVLTILSHHIEKEKLNVETVITESQKLFIELTNKIKDSITKELDAQVEVLKANFQFYKSQYSSFYRGDQVKCSEFPSLADVMKQLNSCNDKKELENRVNKLFQDVTVGNSLTGTLEEKILQMEQKVVGLSQLLKAQMSMKPSSSSILEILQTRIDTAIGNLTNVFEKNQNELCSNKIPSLLKLGSSITFDSILLKTNLEQSLLKKWISPELMKPSLLYRGSRDGYTSAIFHQKCDNFQHTITILETNHGKIIGGYSDQTWNHEANYKTGEKCFLFSITDREVYPLKNEKRNKAISGDKTYGPWFGDGHDLKIFSEFNTNPGSYSAVGGSYDAKGTTRPRFGGGYNFTVKEIEVFAMESI
jgi:hypothetical protein